MTCLAKWGQQCLPVELSFNGVGPNAVGKSDDGDDHVRATSSRESPGNDPVRSASAGRNSAHNVGGNNHEEQLSFTGSLTKNFLGHSHKYFKIVILGSLIANPLIVFMLGPTIGTWGVLLQFLFTLAMALEAYPLQAGGLLVIEANLLGLTNPHTLLHEVTANLNVIIMIIFMVASIHFLKNLLLWVFTKILLQVKDKIRLSVLFLCTAAIMSAFLDALTVTAVVVSVCSGFLAVYYYVVKECSLPRIQQCGRAEMPFELAPSLPKQAKKKPTKEQVDNLMSAAAGSRRPTKEEIEHQLSSGSVAAQAAMEVGQELPESPRSKRLVNGDGTDFEMPSLAKVMERKISEPNLEKENSDLKEIDENIKQFQKFLRSLLMHCAVGTTFGGIMTMVGEPQNLIVAERMEWSFAKFMVKMFPVWGCVLPGGIFVCATLEYTKQFGYGAQMPDDVRDVLEAFEQKEYGKLTGETKALLGVQIIGAILLCIGLVMHFAEVGFIGLMVVIIVSSFNGVTHEHEIAVAFLESMPFVSLLVVFFGIVGMIHDQHLFQPIISWVLALDESLQTSVLFLVNGLLSMVSDNVFVATIFVDEVAFAFHGHHTHSGHEGGHGGHGGHAGGHEHGHKDGSSVHHRLLAEAAGTMSRAMYEKLGIAIVSGTNLPSMATPNGQASLLFLLTSNIAPLVHLSYGRMCLMTLPYTIMATGIGLFAVVALL